MANREVNYKLVTLSDGAMFVKTTVAWYRSFGKCNLQRFHKNGEIHTQSKLRAWAKKYGVDVSGVIDKLPKTVWWQQ